MLNFHIIRSLIGINWKIKDFFANQIPTGRNSYTSLVMSETREDIDVIVSLPDGVDLDGAYKIFVSMVRNAMVGA